MKETQLSGQVMAASLEAPFGSLIWFFIFTTFQILPVAAHTDEPTRKPDGMPRTRYIVWLRAALWLKSNLV